MAEGTKVGGAYVELKADAAQFKAEVDASQQRLHDFAEQAKKDADSVENSSAKVAGGIKGFIAPAAGLFAAFSKLAGVVGAVVGVLTIFIKVGNQIELLLNRKAVAAEKVREQIAGLNKEFGELVKTFNETRRSAEDAAVASAIKPFVEQLAALQERLLDPKISSEVRTAVIEQAKNIAKLRNETEDDVRREYAAKRAIEDEKAAQERADKETKRQRERLDDFQKYADQIGDMILTDREKAERDFFNLRRELEDKGFTNLLEDLEKAKKKRLEAIDEEERAREAAHQRELQRIEEVRQRELDAIRDVAEAQARAQAGKFGGLGLSASGGDEAVRLLKRLVKVSESSRYAGTPNFIREVY